eukprot:358939-Pelagomonas_calceolata.AAC.1
MSAIITAVGQYSNLTSFLATRSPAKWYTMSMCLDLADAMGFFRSVSAAWLSVYIWMVLRDAPMSAMSLRSHSGSFTAWAAAMYSASGVDTATVACSRLDQLMMPPFRMNT